MLALGEREAAVEGDAEEEGAKAAALARAFVGADVDALVLELAYVAVKDQRAALAVPEGDGGDEAGEG